ncbi:MAG: putative tricarboxylic transport membrane protein [Rubritalea sp.]|jgi:putative tricarboxylic transport membrane protein
MLAKPIAKLSLNFIPWEYFTLVLMALVLIATIGGKSLSKSLFAGFLGILLSMPGIAAATGQTRLTFNLPELNDGFKLLPVLIGLFAVNQILREIINNRKASKAPAIHTKGAKIRLKDFAQHGVNMVRSSIIGTWIGLLPGIGANIRSVTSYAVAKSTSKTPEKFGTGHEDGIVAAESANNATIGGALIPLVAMGIPGSVVEAVLLGALVVHGLQPGPRLFTESPSMVYTIMGATILANFAMAAIMLVSMKNLAKLAKIPLPYLMPLILAFCIIGAFALNNRIFDVWVMLGFGLLGFFLESKNIPLAPFVIGFVLGPIAEENLTIALLSETPIFTRPISIVFIAVAFIMLLLPIFKKMRNQLKMTSA